MSQAPNVPALPQRSRKGAAIMPISDTLGWVGGRCRSGSPIRIAKDTAVTSHATIPVTVIRGDRVRRSRVRRA